MNLSKLRAIDFFDDISSKHARKWFFCGFILFAVFSLGVLLASEYLLPDSKGGKILSDIAKEIFVNIILITGFYCIYLYLIGPNEEPRLIRVVRPEDIGDRLKQLRQGTRRYIFWGRSGSYFRAEPLRFLSDIAQKTKTHIDIEVLLPNPTNARLASAYRDIVQSLNEDRQENELTAQVLATSIACAVISANNKYVSIKLIYSDFLPAFRLDMGDAGALLTQDDRAKAALEFSEQSEFYEMLKTTVRNEMAMSVEAEWDKEIFVGRKLDESSCDIETMKAFIPAIEDVDGLQLKVGRLVAGKKHRYSR